MKTKKPIYLYDSSTGETVKLVKWDSKLVGFAEVEQDDGSTYLTRHIKLFKLANAQSKLDGHFKDLNDQMQQRVRYTTCEHCGEEFGFDSQIKGNLHIKQGNE